MIKNFNSTTGMSSKLLPKFKGPYEVTKIFNNDRYLIKDIEGFQRTQRPYEGIWAAHNIKPWFKNETINFTKRQNCNQDNIKGINKKSLQENGNRICTGVSPTDRITS